MQNPPVELWWPIIIGSGVLLMMALGLITTVITDQRRFISAQRAQLDELSRKERALRQAEKNYRDIFENAAEGIYQSTPDGRYLSVNPALAGIYGYRSPEEFLYSINNIGNQIYFDPIRREEFKRQLHQFKEVHGFEYEAFRKDGTKIWISGNARAVDGPNGEVSYYEGFIEDITERKRSEAALRKSDERFHMVARATNDAVWDMDVQTNQVWWSQNFQTLFGYRPDEIDPRFEFWLDRLHPEDKQKIVSGFYVALEGEERTWSSEYRFRRGDGTYSHVFDRVYVIRSSDGRPVRLVGAMMDITGRKRVEEALRSLPKRIIDAQETERRRVARELHDSVNQILSSVKFRVQSVEEKLPARNRTIIQQVGQVKLLLDKVILEVRRISQNLRPSELDDLGLASALKSLLDEFTERTNIAVKYRHAPFKKNLPPQFELTIYRIVQEALTNVEKHSGASEVSVELEQEDLMVAVRINDNGKGLKAEPARRSGKKVGMGLVDIKERLMLLGGRMTIRTGTPTGTELSIRIPLNGEAKSETP